MGRKAPNNGQAWLPVQLPVRGVNVASAFGQQPALTCQTAQNVRGIDPRSQRQRLAQREGIRKYLTAQVSSTSRVQMIGQVVGTSVAVSGALDTRKLFGLAAAGGTVKSWEVGSTGLTSVTNGTTALSTTAAVIFGTEHTAKFFFADGASQKYYDSADNTIKTWTPSDGTLPVDSANYPRLITTWRGRIVLSGIRSDARNWFMSAVGDPLDWDYSPATTVETQAVAGNNSEAGKVGDVINGLVPAGDDTLIFLCDHSVWRMTGDPMAGGRIDLISDVTGGAFGQAWCKDPEGTIYFMGTKGGVYKLPRGSMQLERISRPIDERIFNSVDFSDTLIRMVWNDAQEGFYLFVTPLDDGTTTNYFYDGRTQAWWPDAFGETDHQPRAVEIVDGSGPTDRAVLIGGADGYIRVIDASVNDDDGEAIESSCTLGPLQGKRMEAFLLKELQAVMADNVDRNQVTYEVLTGDSAQDAYLSTARQTGTWTEGRNRSTLVRLDGAAFYIRVTNDDDNETWAMESLQALLMPRGMSRQRSIVK